MFLLDYNIPFFGQFERVTIHVDYEFEENVEILNSFCQQSKRVYLIGSVKPLFVVMDYTILVVNNLS